MSTADDQAMLELEREEGFSALLDAHREAWIAAVEKEAAEKEAAE